MRGNKLQMADFCCTLYLYKKIFFGKSGSLMTVWCCAQANMAQSQTEAVLRWRHKLKCCRGLGCEVCAVSRANPDRKLWALSLLSWKCQPDSVSKQFWHVTPVCSVTSISTRAYYSLFLCMQMSLCIHIYTLASHSP